MEIKTSAASILLIAGVTATTAFLSGMAIGYWVGESEKREQRIKDLESLAQNA